MAFKTINIVGIVGGTPMLSRTLRTPIRAGLRGYGSSFGKFDWKDPLQLQKQLTEEESLVMYNRYELLIIK